MDSSDGVSGLSFRARRTLFDPGADRLSVAPRCIRRSGNEEEAGDKCGTSRESVLKEECLDNENDLLSGFAGDDGVLCGDFGDLAREDAFEATKAESEILRRGRSLFGRVDCPDAIVLLRVSFPGRSVIDW